MGFDLAVLKNQLNKRGFQTFVCDRKHEAVDLITQSLIDENDNIIGIGNSMTIKELGLTDYLSSKTVYVRNPSGSGEDERKALHADIYFTSANAVSYDGQIVNIDGTGNRVAATCYGPKHVVFVIGKNKIAETLDLAIERAQNAAVALAKHYGRKTPCTVTGKCEHCLVPECICAVTAVHRKRLYGNKISVVLVNEEMGL